MVYFVIYLTSIDYIIHFYNFRIEWVFLLIKLIVVFPPIDTF